MKRSNCTLRNWLFVVAIVGACALAPAQDLPEARSVGSPDVPVDSWVYPAFERLAARGLVHTQFLGLRPWTRFACATLTREANDNVAAHDAGKMDSDLVARLAREFAPELDVLDEGSIKQVQLDSLYTRVTGIAGTPLADSFHFGQTVINDYGRPYGGGVSAITGLTASGQAGMWFGSLRAEYQHSPGVAPYSTAVQNTLNQIDEVTTAPLLANRPNDRFTILDATAGVAFSGWNLSVGKQSLWWGTGQNGGMLFSSNAEPMYMARMTRTVPAQLPGFLHRFGTMRTEFFFGSLAGHFHPGHPFIHGQKISFRPTQNLEVGFSRTALFAGTGRGLTFGRFFRSLTSVGGVDNTIGGDPGDRRSSIDFSYRIPGLRRWLTIYSDSIADDDPSPIAAPRRAGFNPGIYLPQLPKLPRLDFRAEAAYTDVPAGRSVGGRFIYWNGVYRDGYTNQHNLLGNWVGREGRGLQLSSTYWLSPRNTVQFGYRNGRVSPDFIPGGGSLSSGSLKTNFWWKQKLQVTAGLQVERWSFPLLSARDQTDVMTSLQLTWWPRWRRGEDLPPRDQEGLRWKRVRGPAEVQFPKGKQPVQKEAGSQ